MSPELDLSDPLVARQVALESAMLDAGAAAYRKKVSDAAGRTESSGMGAASKLVKSMIAPVALAIEELRADALSGRPGRRHVAVRLLAGQQADAVAFITVSMAFNAAMTTQKKATKTFQAVASQLGKRIEDEAQLQAFSRAHGGILRNEMARFAADGTSAHHMKFRLVREMRRYPFAWTPWPATDVVHLGTRLLDLLMETVGGVTVVRVGQGTRRERLLIQMDDRCADILQRQDLKAQVLVPAFTPMVIPPIPWTADRHGGYLAGSIRPLKLVKPSFGSGPPEGLSPETAPQLFRSINAVQATRWRINRPVLEALRHVWDKKLEVGGLPRQEALGIPKRPDDAPEWATTDEAATVKAAQTRWRHEAHRLHVANTKGRSKRTALAEALRIAGQHVDDAAIFFPHQLDFRGRMYAVPLFLQPQGMDPVRALLEFADGKPLGATGRRWLAIHGANTFGFDKASMDDRVAWAEQRTELVRRTAEEPYGDLWWTEADKPWCFLAWCFEWSRMLTEGDAFVSHLPIALDGSCNGLQHYSALLSDPVGGSATNLVPHPVPSDIYGEVAKVAVAKLRAAGDSTAAGWLAFGVDRKLTKRPVMVLPYGGTFGSCLKYLGEVFQERLQAGAVDPFGDPKEHGAALKYLADVVWASIGEVVVAARVAMDWLRKAAQLATEAGLPITWTAPSGFTVRQDYRDLKSRRVKTRLSGSVTYLSLTEKTEKLDKKRQANGLPPNFVHSLDAAALCATVESALAEGITSFAMIHDSYGTHAGDTEVFSRCIRKAFLEMYTAHDPLGALADNLRQSLPPAAASRLPPLPERGTLDLGQVLQAEYFFA